MFIADAQTKADLGLFSKGPQDSVYKMYNLTRTRGGAETLEEMFRNPLSAPGSINARCGTIQYLAEKEINFGFEQELFDSAEQYLAERDERTRFVAKQQKLGQKIGDWISINATIKNIEKGVVATIALLQGLKHFLSQEAIIGCTAYAAERQSILNQLSNDAFAQLLEQAPQNKLSQEQLSAYDKVLRFSHHREVERLLQHIYSLDVYIAVGKAGRKRAFIYPIALETDTCRLSVTGFYHPLIDNAVPNDLEIGPSGNVIFLTGANMAGKSTLMKSLGINLYLAQMGFPVAAKKMEFSVMDGIYTAINLPDNLGMGISHFYAEVLRLKKVAKELSQCKRLLVIFDELFRGTNVKDAYEGTIAVTKSFALNHNSIFVLSTHITEAGEVLEKDCRNIIFKYMPTRMQAAKPVYTYKLESGITNDRHGMLIIKNERILDILAEGRRKLP